MHTVHVTACIQMVKTIVLQKNGTVAKVHVFLQLRINICQKVLKTRGFGRGWKHGIGKRNTESRNQVFMKPKIRDVMTLCTYQC